MKRRSNQRTTRRRRTWTFGSAAALVMGVAPARRSTRRHPAALPVFSIRLRKALLALAGLSLILALWVGVDGRFYIAQADVRGAVRTSPEEIFRASGLPGLHILWARSGAAERRILAALPTLSSARVRCGVPARCVITVEERQPRVMWEENGQAWWIDAEGVIFAAAAETPPEGWLVHGPLPRDAAGRLHERARVALDELWNADRELIVALQTPQELYYTPERGLTYISPQGWRVILGEGDGMEHRLRVLDRLTLHLTAQGLSPKFVDVRYPGAPYYSLTNEW